MVDEPIPAELLHLIRSFPGMEEAQLVTL
jgi:hypothetical protein